MRILVVNEYAGKLGGVEQYLSHVVPALARRGHRLGLLYQRETSRQLDEFLGMFSFCSRRLEQAMAEFQPEVLFLQRVESLEPYLELPVRRLRYVHDHDLCCPRRHKYYLWNSRPCGHRADWRCWLDLAFLRREAQGWRWFSLRSHAHQLRLHRELDGLLVGSRAMQQELLSNGLDRVEIVPPLIPLDPVPPPPLGRGHVLYVGQMIKGKGVDLLVKALSRVSVDFRATLVGDGNARASVQKLVAGLGLESRVEVAGWVSPSQLRGFYQQAQLVVVPSRWPEPFGMVGLEAMNLARPVVGFEHGGIPDWLEHGHTGLLVPEGNVGELGRAIERLLHDPALAEQLGQNGYLRVRQRFDFEAMVDRLERLLCA